MVQALSKLKGATHQNDTRSLWWPLRSQSGGRHRACGGQSERGRLARVAQHHRGQRRFERARARCACARPLIARESAGQRARSGAPPPPPAPLPTACLRNEDVAATRLTPAASRRQPPARQRRGRYTRTRPRRPQRLHPPLQSSTRALTT